MHSTATSVADYLVTLPEDRRALVEAVRSTILANLDPVYVEQMQDGMIGYAVPLSAYPAGYHTGRGQPLPFAAIASQKNHVSLYLMGVYTGSDNGPGGRTEISRWFDEAWRATGKRLDMGRSCVRLRRLEDVPLDVIGELIRRLPADRYIAGYEAALRASRG